MELASTSLFAERQDFEVVDNKISRAILADEFNQVAFQDMFDTYPNDSDIVTAIKYPVNFVKSKDDRVLLFEVGWFSVNDYVYAAELRDDFVKLNGQAFSKDIKSLYQLCYCISGNRVVGISKPFSFQLVREEDLIEYSRDNDDSILCVKSRFAVLMDKFLMALENKNGDKLERNVSDVNKTAKQRADGLPSDNEKSSDDFVNVYLSENGSPKFQGSKHKDSAHNEVNNNEETSDRTKDSGYADSDTRLALLSGILKGDEVISDTVEVFNAVNSITSSEEFNENNRLHDYNDKANSDETKEPKQMSTVMSLETSCVTSIQGQDKSRVKNLEPECGQSTSRVNVLDRQTDDNIIQDNVDGNISHQQLSLNEQKCSSQKKSISLNSSEIFIETSSLNTNDGELSKNGENLHAKFKEVDVLRIVSKDGVDFSLTGPKIAEVWMKLVENRLNKGGNENRQINLGEIETGIESNKNTDGIVTKIMEAVENERVRLQSNTDSTYDSLLQKNLGCAEEEIDWKERYIKECEKNKTSFECFNCKMNELKHYNEKLSVTVDQLRKDNTMWYIRDAFTPEKFADVFLPEDVDRYMINFPDGFVKGTEVTIKGVIKGPKWFVAEFIGEIRSYLDFVRCDKSAEFKYPTENEITVTIKIICGEHSFEAFINDKISFYAIHQMNPATITSAQVTTNFKINNISIHQAVHNCKFVENLLTTSNLKMKTQNGCCTTETNRTDANKESYNNSDVTCEDLLTNESQSTKQVIDWKDKYIRECQRNRLNFECFNNKMKELKYHNEKLSELVDKLRRDNTIWYVRNALSTQKLTEAFLPTDIGRHMLNFPDGFVKGMEVTIRGLIREPKWLIIELIGETRSYIDFVKCDQSRQFQCPTDNEIAITVKFICGEHSFEVFLNDKISFYALHEMNPTTITNAQLITSFQIYDISIRQADHNCTKCVDLEHRLKQGALEYAKLLLKYDRRGAKENIKAVKKISKINNNTGAN